MIEKQATIYRCGFCNKLYLKKKYCERHEMACSKNPINWRSCFECPNLVSRTGETPTNVYNGDEFKTVRFLFCESRQVALYPPKIERKARGGYEFLYFEDEEYSNEPMPKNGECEVFKAIKKRRESGWIEIS